MSLTVEITFHRPRYLIESMIQFKEGPSAYLICAFKSSHHRSGFAAMLNNVPKQSNGRVAACAMFRPNGLFPLLKTSFVFRCPTHTGEEKEIVRSRELCLATRDGAVALFQHLFFETERAAENRSVKFPPHDICLTLFTSDTLPFTLGTHCGVLGNERGRHSLWMEEREGERGREGRKAWKPIVRGMELGGRRRLQWGWGIHKCTITCALRTIYLRPLSVRSARFIMPRVFTAWV